MKSRSGACWTGPSKGSFSMLSTTTFGGRSGEKSRSAPDARKEVLRSVVSRAPKLIPLIGHRYLPEEPREPGNPVFSVYQADVIYYGADLTDYFEREFAGWDHRPWPDQIKYIRFWLILWSGLSANRSADMTTSDLEARHNISLRTT